MGGGVMVVMTREKAKEYAAKSAVRFVVAGEKSCASCVNCQRGTCQMYNKSLPDPHLFTCAFVTTEIDIKLYLDSERDPWYDDK